MTVDSRLLGRYLNPGSPEYEVGVVTTRPMLQYDSTENIILIQK
jgi:hypothetical protein